PRLGERAGVDPVPRPRRGLDPLRRDRAAERRAAARLEDAGHLGRAVRVVRRLCDRLHPGRFRRLARGGTWRFRRVSVYAACAHERGHARTPREGGWLANWLYRTGDGASPPRPRQFGRALVGLRPRLARGLSSL